MLKTWVRNRIRLSIDRSILLKKFHFSPLPGNVAYRRGKRGRELPRTRVRNSSKASLRCRMPLTVHPPSPSEVQVASISSVRHATSLELHSLTTRDRNGPQNRDPDTHIASAIPHYVTYPSCAIFESLFTSRPPRVDNVNETGLFRA